MFIILLEIWKDVLLLPNVYFVECLPYIFVGSLGV